MILTLLAIAGLVATVVLAFGITIWLEQRHDKKFGMPLKYEYDPDKWEPENH